MVKFIWKFEKFDNIKTIIKIKEIHPYDDFNLLYFETLKNVFNFNL